MSAAPSRTRPVTGPRDVVRDKLILFVVGVPSGLSPGEKAVRARLEALGALGYRVSVVGGEALALRAGGARLVILSSSLPVAADLANRLRAWPVPVLAMRADWYRALALAGGEPGTGFGVEAAETNLVIPSAEHPLAGGLLGTVHLVSEPAAASWALPGPEAIGVGYIEGDPSRAVLFAYERGAALAEGRAPARRVALSLSEGAAARLTRDGERLFDAAVRWAASINSAPWVDAGPDQSVRLGGRVWLHGRVADDGLPADRLVAVRWTVVSGPGGVAFEDDEATVTTATPAKPGVYVLRLSATDGELQGSDEVTAEVSEAVTPGGRTDSGALPGKPVPEGPSAEVLLIVGNAASLTPGDATIRNRALLLSLTVEAKTAANVTAPDVAGRSMVFLSNSVSGADAEALADNFLRVATVPVVVMGTPALDNMSMIQTANRGVTPGEQLKIYAPHPIAGGLQGIVTTHTSPASFAWGKPEPQPSPQPYRARVAVIPEMVPDPTTLDKAAAFAYETGDTMVSQFLAPARRVGFGLDTGVLTSDGTALLDNLMRWLAGRNLAPIVEAGANTITPLGTPVNLDGTVTDDGLPGVPLHTHWSVVTGPGLVTFADSTEVDTTATFSAVGSYALRLTASDSELEGHDDVVVVVRNSSQQNFAPVVSAGVDQAFTLPGGVVLFGTAWDDGLPLPPGALTYQWTQVSGPAPAQFGNAQLPTTSATFTTMGTYVLRLTASDGALSASDDVMVTAKGKALLVVCNTQLGPGDALLKSRLEALKLTVTVKAHDQATSGDATGRQLVVVSTGGSGGCNGGAISTMFSSVAVPVMVTDGGVFDGMGMATVRGVAATAQGVIADPTHPIAAGLRGILPWTLTTDAIGVSWGQPLAGGIKVVTVPGSPQHSQVFAFPAGAIANARRVAFGIFPDSGTVQLTPAGQAILDAAIQWAVGANLPPSVDVGPDLTITEGSPASLSAVVSDDALLMPFPLLEWSQASGPAGVVFSQPTSANTTATFPAPGVYHLRLTANDGELTGADTLAVTVTPAGGGGPANAAPTVMLGPDRTHRLPATLSLSAVVSDDGRPAPPAQLSVTWSQVSGPSGVIITPAPNQTDASVTFPAAGVYTLRVTASDTVLSAFDEVQVTVEAAGDALFVVSGQNTNPLRPEDAATDARLKTLGFGVTVVGDGAPSSSANNRDLIVISRTSNSENVGGKFKQSAVPAVVLEWAVFDDMAMTPTEAFGASQTATSVQVADPSHALAAGLSGVRTVFSPPPPVPVAWGLPGGQAFKVAALDASLAQWTVFGYESGAQMEGGFKAPARRVGFFSAPYQTTGDGLALFDAAIRWATDRTVPALLVTGSTTLTPSDLAIARRMEAVGLAPKVATSAAVVASDANGKALTVIAPSANAAQLGIKLRDTAPASLTALAGAFANMGLTTGGGSGTVAGQTQVDILKPAHPLAAGLVLPSPPAPPTVVVTSVADTYQWGQPSTGGTIVASITADPPKGAIFAYGIGATLASGATTVDRRVGYYLGPNSAQNLTVEGLELLDAALAWLVSSDLDGDGLTTLQEHRYGTDPSVGDTNGDGIPDGAAIASGLSATNPDMDGDGLQNADEIENGTDPFRWDTDGDGYSDLVDAYPLDPTRWSVPPGVPGAPVITLLEPTNAIPVP